MRYQIAVCKLCDRESNLRQSHIIPRSYLKGLKSSTGQTIEVDLNGVIRPKKQNFDPKSFLLCNDCEQYISQQYEKYCIEYLRNIKNYSDEGRYLIFSGFDFKNIYLYFISILWRASISDHQLFEKAKLGGFEKYLKISIKNNSLIVGNYARIQDFIRITIYKIVDNNKILPEKFLDNIFINFFIEGEKDLLSLCFVIEGYAICYSLGDFRAKRRLPDQITNRRFQVVPKISFENWPIISEIISKTIEQAQAHPNP